MDDLARVALALIILIGAVRAIRRDSRYDRREILVQLAWVAVFIAATVAVVWAAVLMTAGLGDRQAIVVVAVTLVWVTVSVIALAVHLQRRLARRSGN